MTKRKLRRLEKRTIDAKKAGRKAYDRFKKLNSYCNECEWAYIAARREMQRGYK